MSLSTFVVTLAPFVVATPQDPVAAHSPAAPDWAVVPPTGGRLEERDGARVLLLTGSDVERGFAEGYHLADEIVACFEEFALGHVTRGLPKAWDLVLGPLIRDRFVFTERDTTWARAVVTGMSLAREGDLWIGALERDFEARDLLACAAVPDVAGILCSSLAAWGDATDDGDVHVGRNLDYPSTPALRNHSILRVHAPFEDRAGWVDVGWPGVSGCLTGLSARGVFLAIHDVDDVPAERAGGFTPRSIALRDVIESIDAADDPLEHATRILRSHRFMMGGNAMLAWQSDEGDGARGAGVLEMSTDRSRDDGVTPRRARPGDSFVACSNHFRARADEPQRCRRHRLLLTGARDGAVSVARAWDLVRAAGMDITLYRCVADLGADTLEVQRRTDDGWSAIACVRADGSAPEAAAAPPGPDADVSADPGRKR